MNKTQLVESIATKAGITQADAAKALAAFTETIKDCMKNNDKVQITGFGTFEPSVKEAHAGRNPKTGETIQIAAKKSAKFKMGKELSTAIN